MYSTQFPGRYALRVFVVTLLAVLAGVMPALRARAVDAAPSGGTGTRQLITVTAPSYTATYATLRVYELSGTKRVLIFGPWTARVGYNGVARPGRKHEGDGKTPSGTYGLSFFFGVQGDLGFAFPFRHAYAYDY